MKISIVHPSRNRPEKARRCYDYWTKRGQPHEWIISLDHDDRYLNNYRYLFRDTKAKLVVNQNNYITGAVNSGARETTGDLLIVVSDDFLCPENWHDDLLKHIGDRRDFVGRVADGNQKWIVTLPMMDREYYKGKGYLYNPIYQHMFCDTEMTAVAELEGKILDIPMTFEHEHPMYGKVKEDAINQRANRTWNQGMAVYLRRFKINFGIANPVGVITNAEHLEWVKDNRKKYA